MKINKIIIDYVLIVLGAGVMAVALNLFLLPSTVAPGGFSGIAAIVYYLTGFPVGGIISLLNIPLIAFSVRQLGKKFVFRTLFGIAVYSVLAEVIPVYYIAPDVMISALFGGLIMGAGIGIIVNAGATTGGSEVVASLIHKKFRHISVATGIFIVDLCVIAVYAIIFDPLNALYGIFSLFISTWIIERVTSGLRRGKALLIISEHHERIKQMVLEDMERGVTGIRASGGYTGREMTVLLVTVARPSEAVKLKSMIHAVDAHAFIINWNATEVLGSGFAELYM